MKKKVPILLPLLAFIFSISLLSAQNGVSYRIDQAGDYDLALLEQSLDQANLDAYRRLETDRSLLFDNGAEVTLFPAKHLESLGLEVNLTLAIAEDAEIDPNRIFLLHPSGYLLEQIRSNSKIK